ncbi:G/T mismatch-specific thymine DNA glycosylase-like [Ptychodera flava]|uniref:G/T mismatch-specific thymine DNA glycosylase-like n=1 Tax=Ptychodera flava TaxID=63121 RepID=UPI00396A27D9
MDYPQPPHQPSPYFHPLVKMEPPDQNMVKMEPPDHHQQMMMMQYHHQQQAQHPQHPQQHHQHPQHPQQHHQHPQHPQHHQQHPQHHQQQQHPQQHLQYQHQMQQQQQQQQPAVSNTPTKGRKKKIKQEKITDAFPAKKRRKVDRFQGMPEEEVLKRTLPDHLDYNLDIAIVGINPGLFAAFKGHHYAGPGNHFWKCLYLSGLIPEPMTCLDDHRLKEYGIGFTNIVERTSRGSADLTRKEIKEGGKLLLKKIQQYKPKIVCFNGKGIYEIFSGKKDFEIGRQPEPIEGTDTVIFVMPSSSARCSQFPRATDKVQFYLQLKKLRNDLTGRPHSPDPIIPPPPPPKSKSKGAKVKTENNMANSSQLQPILYENQGFVATAQASSMNAIVKSEPPEEPQGPNSMGFVIKQEPPDSGYGINSFEPGSFIDNIPTIHNYPADPAMGHGMQGCMPHSRTVMPSASSHNQNIQPQQANNLDHQLPNFSDAFQVKQEGGPNITSCHYNPQ